MCYVVVIILTWSKLSHRHSWLTGLDPPTALVASMSHMRAQTRNPCPRVDIQGAVWQQVNLDISGAPTGTQRYLGLIDRL